MRRAALALAVVVALAAGARRAHAFSRFKTERGLELFWKQSCVVVTLYLNGFEGLHPDEIYKSVAAAAEAWRSDAVVCGDGGARPYVEIVTTLAPAGAAPPPVSDDARSTIVFRTESWTMSGRPDGVAYDPKAAAVTHVHSAPDGHITGADIEINGIDKLWANLDPGVSPSTGSQQIETFTDLQNTMTHEFGHLLGLEHTCFRPSAADATVNAQGKIRWNDDAGQRVPDCETAPPAVKETVMFDGAMAEEVSKRTLSPDEIAAACTIYSPTFEHDVCALDLPADGCALAPAPVSDPPVLVLVLVLVAVLVRERSRRSPTEPRRARS